MYQYWSNKVNERTGPEIRYTWIQFLGNNELLQPQASDLTSQSLFFPPMWYMLFAVFTLQGGGEDQCGNIYGK